MLKRQYRLPISVRFFSAQTFSTPLFQMKKTANDLGIIRLGFIVSKRIDKRAVVRNRTKRVFRSVLEELLTKLNLGFDLLFILRKPIEKRDEELEREIKNTLEKAGVLSFGRHPELGSGSSPVKKKDAEINSA